MDPTTSKREVKPHVHIRPIAVDEKTHLLAVNSASPKSSISLSSPSSLSPPIWLLILLLFLIPFTSVNNFFAYHAPGAIGSSLQAYFGLDPTQFGALFTIYSAPNIVLVFFGGVWIDRVGVIKTSIVFNTLMLAGMIIFALAPAEPRKDEHGVHHASGHSMLVLLTGRLLLGLGGECLCAGASAMVAKWFRHSWLTLACGMNQALVQLFGSAAAFILLPLIMKGEHPPSSSSSHHNHHAAEEASSFAFHVRLCLWITVGVCVLSLICNLIYSVIEWNFGHYLPKDEHESSTLPQYESIHDSTTVTSEGHTIQVVDVATSTSSPLAESDSQTLTGLERVSRFSMLFWLVLSMHCLLSPILYTFTAFGPVALMERYGVSESEAGELTSLLYIAIILSPLMGALIDATGYRAQWQLVASSTIPIFFGCIFATDLPPRLLMIGLGLAYSITECNGLAMIGVSVSPSYLGTAYGLLGCGISIALLFEPYAVGFLKVTSGRYDEGTLMFGVVTALGALLACIIVIYDRTRQQTMTRKNQPSEHS